MKWELWVEASEKLWSPYNAGTTVLYISTFKKLTIKFILSKF